MPVIDYAALPEFPMRPGITGKWIASRERGAAGKHFGQYHRGRVRGAAASPPNTRRSSSSRPARSGSRWTRSGRRRRPGQCVIISANAAHAWGNDGPEVLRVLFVWNSPEPFAPGKSTYLEGAPPAVT